MALLAFDIGGTAVKYGLYNSGHLLETSSFSTPKTWEEIKTLLYKVFEGYNSKAIQGIAISSPGAVDSERGLIGGISAVPYIHHFPIVEELEDLFQLPVTIENDANCAALAEVAFGVARDCRDVLFFVIGSGIGGAVIIDGKLHKGKNLFGGEFGYMMMDDEKTLSQLASPVQVASCFSKERAIESPLTGKALFDRADQGDQEAQKAVNALYDQLARAIFNASLVINPDRVVIGGGISKRPGLVDELDKRLTALKERTEARELEIDVRVCRYFNDANLLGAVANFIASKGESR